MPSAQKEHMPLPCAGSIALDTRAGKRPGFVSLQGEMMKKSKTPPLSEKKPGPAGTLLKKNAPAKKNHEPPAPPARFPIVGIGASAGGLEAFELFFKTLPAKSGIAFVLIPHLDPGHASMLSEILQRNTTMPVHEALDNTTIQPDNVYIIPPNKDMAVFHGAISLSVPELARGLRLPIDAFFRSLAEDQGERAICVILSGSGSDGTLGLRAIHGVGGVSFVQEPSTAKYDGMPRSAINSGLATYVLPVEKITAQLVAYVKTIAETGVPPAPPLPASLSAMRRIMMLLRTKTGNDFSQYKQSTIRRRIERRMGVHNLADMDAYARYLAENPAEGQILFKELLINVTSFFRDKEAFEALNREALPRLFANKPETHIFRIWVPGCASGEEAYSLAMLFSEYMDGIKQEFKLQIYATDIDDDAIASARAGTYPANIAIDVSPERLRRFFAKEESGYRIKKEIRECVVFAIQNVIKDPPFTKMDLISCRNLLIYLDGELQSRVIPAFHYALRPGGVLFLSPSEGIGNFTDLFGPVDKKWKIYQAKPSMMSANTLVARRFAWTGEKAGREPVEVAVRRDKTNVAELTKRVLLQSFAPPSVITDETGNIVYVHGDTGKYLQPAPGHISTSVIDMAREGLQLDLRLAIQSAAGQKIPVAVKGLPVRTNGGIHGVDLTVRPLADPDTSRELLLISFQDTPLPLPEKRTAAKRTRGSGESKRLDELEEELTYTKENLQATIEEMQAANEELTSTNEEHQSTNEELQSTNEELETSKEELQSVNEEIITVNAELQAKIEQLTGIQNDMKNLLENVNIGTIFLDDHLTIRRFTREASRVFRFAAADTGRPLADIRSLISDVDLIADAQAVLDSLIPKERAVRTTNNEWFLVRIMPYRTLENVIDGVVLTFSDITALKTAEAGVRAARDYAENIVDTIREPLVVLNGKFEVVSASRAFFQKFHVTPEETVGKVLYTLGDRQWDLPRLHELLETVLPKETVFENVRIEHEFPGIGLKTMLLNARQITNAAGTPAGTPQLILLAIEDVTGQGSAAEGGRAGRRDGKRD
jgi:two-component system, chemotaxis family, CheB/CheR fusion protein